MKSNVNRIRRNGIFKSITFLFSKFKGAKQIVVVHDLYPLEQLEKTSLKLKITYWVSLFSSMLNADTIFTVSEFSKED